MSYSQPETPAPAGYQAHPLTWLLGSLLFFFVVTVLGPELWTGLEKPGEAPTQSTANKVLAALGLVAFFTEPLIWHYILLFNAQKTTPPLTLPGKRQPSRQKPLADRIYNLAYGLFWALPTAVFFIFKPILRALLLFLSLSFLGDVQAPGNGWNRFFNIAVAADIFLYYLCRLAPNWKYNPVNWLLRHLVLKRTQATRLVADLLLVLHTAVTSSLLLALMYTSFRLEGKEPTLQALAACWLTLTLYNRLSLQPGKEEDSSFQPLPRTNHLLLEILQLSVSFLAFIWPFYFSGQ